MKNRNILTIAIVLTMLIAGIPALLLADTNSSAATESDFLGDMNKALNKTFGEDNGTIYGTFYATEEVNKKLTIYVDVDTLNSSNVSLETKGLIDNFQSCFTSGKYTILLGDQAVMTEGQIQREVFVKFMLKAMDQVLEDGEWEHAITVTCGDEELDFVGVRILVIGSTSALDSFITLGQKMADAVQFDAQLVAIQMPLVISEGATIGSVFTDTITSDLKTLFGLTNGEYAILNNIAGIFVNSTYGGMPQTGLKALEPLLFTTEANTTLALSFDYSALSEDVDNVSRLAGAVSLKGTAVDTPVTENPTKYPGVLTYLDDSFDLTITTEATASTFTYGPNDPTFGTITEAYGPFSLINGATVEVSNNQITITDINGHYIRLYEAPSPDSTEYTYAFKEWMLNGEVLKTGDKVIAGKVTAIFTRTSISGTETTVLDDGTTINEETKGENAGDKEVTREIEDGSWVVTEYSKSSDSIVTTCDAVVINNQSDVTAIVAEVTKQAEIVGSATADLTVAIDATDAASNRNMSVTLTTNSLTGLINSADKVSLMIDARPADVTFNNKALQSISATGAGEVVMNIQNTSDLDDSVKDAKQSYRFDVTVGGERVNFRNSSIDVQVPYQLSGDENVKKTYVLHMKDNGAREKLKASYDNVTSLLGFTTTGFSSFYVIPGTSAAPDHGGDDDGQQGGDEGFVLNKNMTFAIAIFVLVLAILALAVTIGKNKR